MFIEFTSLIELFEFSPSRSSKVKKVRSNFLQQGYFASSIIIPFILLLVSF